MRSGAKGAARRPTSAERRSRILRAAAGVFFEHGFSATSIDMVIERTGGSKRAIYAEFGSKEGLFTALVTAFAEQALAPLDIEDDGAEQDLRRVLIRFAESLVAIYVSQELVGVYRAIVTEAYRFPRLAEAFYHQGPGRAARELQARLEAAVSRGHIPPLDAAAAADHFVGMLRDNLHLQVVLGLREAPDEAELQRRAIAAVDIFLVGIAGRPSEAGPSDRGLAHSHPGTSNVRRPGQA
jgi:AcrR family transcriptional regulator